MKRCYIHLTVVLALLCLTAPARADRFVDDDNSSDDANDCTNQASPCATIAHALDEASAGESIHIAAGTYTETLTIDQNVTLQGAGADANDGTVIQAAPDAGIASARVITVDPEVNPQPQVAISGMVIRHGVSLGGSPDDRGGGFFADSATVEISDVLFTDNAGREGGALFQFRGELMLNGVTFGPGNHADFGGGGMRTFDTPAQLTGVTFTGNTSDVSGGGLFVEGGSPELKNVTFTGNTAAGDGGGLFLTNIDPGTAAVVVNGMFHGNSANNGGAVAFDGGEQSAVNLTIGGNSAQENGGGVYNTTFSSPELINTIVWGNTAAGGAQIYNDDNSSVQLDFSLYGNEPGDIRQGGGFTASNSLTDDPLFADAGNGNLRLSADSPAIGTGDPATDPALFPGGPDNPVDLDGNPRFAGGQVDIGAYEVQPPDRIFDDRFEE